MLKIFFRELKSKWKFAKAIKRHVSEDVYKGAIQENFSAILPQINKEYGSQKEIQILYIQQIKREL